MKKVIAGVLAGLSFAPMLVMAMDRESPPDRPTRPAIELRGTDRPMGERDRGTREARPME